MSGTVNGDLLEIRRFSVHSDKVIPKSTSGITEIEDNSVTKNFENI